MDIIYTLYNIYIFLMLEFAGSQVYLGAYEHSRPQSWILAIMDGNLLFPKCGIVDTVIRGRPGYLVFHTIKSYYDCKSSQPWYDHHNGRVTRIFWGNYQCSTIFFFSNYLYSVGAITSTVLTSRRPTNHTILIKICIDIQETGVK